MNSLQYKYTGAMVGGAIGDAIGDLTENKNLDKTGLLSLVSSTEQLRYTDDTVMSIALAESLTKEGYVNPQALGDSFLAHYKNEPWRGYGKATPQIFAKVEQDGMGYNEAAQTLFGGQGSMGNGSAMRITPLGLFYQQDKRLYHFCEASSEPTHTHPIGIDGAAVVAKAVAIAVSLNPRRPFPKQKVIDELLQFAKTPEIQEKLLIVKQAIQDNAHPSDLASTLATSYAAHQSVGYAVLCFLSHPHSFQECLFSACLHGADPDTQGAMACSISGAYLGIDALPHQWIDKLENKHFIDLTACSLAARKHSEPKAL